MIRTLEKLDCIFYYGIWFIPIYFVPFTTISFSFLSMSVWLSGWRSVSALASHRCYPGSIPGVCMWDGHVVTRLDRWAFFQVLRVSSNHEDLIYANISSIANDSQYKCSYKTCFVLFVKDSWKNRNKSKYKQANRPDQTDRINIHSFIIIITYTSIVTFIICIARESKLDILVFNNGRLLLYRWEMFSFIAVASLIAYLLCSFGLT